jgi:hypothetical protein
MRINDPDFNRRKIQPTKNRKFSLSLKGNNFFKKMEILAPRATCTNGCA